LLQNIDDQVRDCVQQATDCAERANEVIDPRERADWLSLHSRYLALARGIETSRRLVPKPPRFARNRLRIGADALSAVPTPEMDRDCLTNR
jgi:hypothetical protein